MGLATPSGQRALHPVASRQPRPFEGTLFFAAPIRVTLEDCLRTPTAVAVLAGVLECAKLAISAYLAANWRSAGVLLRLHTPLRVPSCLKTIRVTSWPGPPNARRRSAVRFRPLCLLVARGTVRAISGRLLRPVPIADLSLGRGDDVDGLSPLPAT
jgi:hypothetical protein